MLSRADHLVQVRANYLQHEQECILVCLGKHHSFVTRVMGAKGRSMSESLVEDNLAGAVRMIRIMKTSLNRRAQLEKRRSGIQVPSKLSGPMSLPC